MKLLPLNKIVKSMIDKVFHIFNSLVLIVILSNCNSSSSALPENVALELESLKIAGNALRKNGIPFEINTTIYAADSNGNVSKGKIQDNFGNFEFIFTADTQNKNRNKGLGSSIILCIGQYSSEDFMAIVFAQDFNLSRIHFNFNSISLLVSTNFLKNIDLPSLYSDIKSTADLLDADKPKTLDSSSQEFLKFSKLSISNSFMQEYAKVITDTVFGIDGIQFNFLNSSFYNNENLLLESGFLTMGDLNFTTITDINFKPLLNNRKFYQNIAERLPLHINFTTYFRILINRNSEAYRSLNIKNESQFSIIDELNEYLKKKIDFVIDVSNVSPQFVIFIESTKNGRILSTNIIDSFMPVKLGENVCFSMSPQFGYTVNTLTVDGLKVEPSLRYTFSSISASHTISATFKLTSNILSIGSPAWSDVGIVSIDAGESHSVAYMADGSIKYWGGSISPKINKSNFGTSDIISIAINGNYLFTLYSNGNLVQTDEGYGDVVFAFNPLIDINVKSMAVCYSNRVTLKFDGSVLDFKDVIGIAAGYKHSLILNKDGTIFTWGGNENGQLEIPANLNNVIAIAAGDEHSVALKSDGTVVAWGSNFSGESIVPIGLTDVKAIAARGSHTVALKKDGTVVEWGKVGGWWKDPIELPFPLNLTDVIAIAAGQFHTIALKKDGTIVGWGDNTYGQANYLSMKNGVRKIVGKTKNTIALMNDGSIEGMGFFFDKNLGLSGVVSIAEANEYMVALKNDGTVFEWWTGYVDNFIGLTQPKTFPPDLSDIKNVIQIDAGNNHVVALKSDGTVISWGLSNEYGESTVPIDLKGVRAIAAGGSHSVALKHNGIVVAWGKNEGGQINIPFGLNDVIAVAAGLTHTVALKSNGTVVAWGGNEFGQTTVPPELKNVISIKTGLNHTVALTRDGTVFAWGQNSEGQTLVPKDLPPVKAIDAGNTNTMLFFK